MTLRGFVGVILLLPVPLLTVLMPAVFGDSAAVAPGDRLFEWLQLVVAAVSGGAGGWLIYGRQGSGWGVFSGVALALLGFANVHFVVAQQPFWPGVMPDSFSYLQFQIGRVPGVAALYQAFMGVADLRAGAVVQLNVLLLSTLFLFASAALLTRRPVVMALFLFGALLNGDYIAYGVVLLSEAPFVSFVNLFLGFCLLALARGGLSWLVAAGVVLSLATMMKEVAIVLVVPAIIFGVFFRERVRTAIAALAVPAIAGYLLLSSINYVYHDVFAATNRAGIAMGAYVGWLLTAAPAGEEEAIMQDIASAMASERASWPEELAYPHEYAPFVRSRYRPILLRLYDIIIQHEKQTTIDWDAVLAKRVVVFNLLTYHAITQHPFLYARHVAANYLMMWYEASRSDTWRAGLMNINDTRKWLFDERVSELGKVRLDFQTPNRADVAAESAHLDRYTVGLDWIGRGFRQLHPIVIWCAFAVSLLACVAAFWAWRHSATAKGIMLISLVVNAYFGGHTLAHVPLPRYAQLADPWLLAMMGLVLTLPRWGHLAAAVRTAITMRMGYGNDSRHTANVSSGQRA